MAKPLPSGGLKPSAKGNYRLVILAPSHPARPFLLTSWCASAPDQTPPVEGLYAAAELFTTQCEAEGFRADHFHT